MDREIFQKQAKKPRSTPTLRKIELTDDERAQLQESDDPMAQLLRIRPDIKPGR